MRKGVDNAVGGDNGRVRAGSGGRGQLCVYRGGLRRGDAAGREPAAGESFFGRDDAEVDRTDVAELSVVLRHRRAGAVDDHDVFQDE